MELSETLFFTSDEPFTLNDGSVLPEMTLAYELYGTVNEARDNVILVFHALTGSQHLAGVTPAVAGVGERWTEEFIESLIPKAPVTSGQGG